MNNRIFPALVVQSLALLGVAVSGCGGGGGGNGGAPANTPPQVSAVSLGTNEDQAGTATLTATDANGDTLTASITAQPAKGTATLTGSNPFTVTYTPIANLNGADTLTVTVSDGHGGSANAVVAVTIAAQPDAPVMNAQNFSGNEDTVIGAQVAAADADGDALTFTATTQPAHGTLTLPASGVFSYTPNANYFGADQFNVQVSDGTLTSTATISLAVASVNDLPVVMDDDVNIAGAGPADIDVLANDSDVENDPLTVSIISLPPGAAAVVVANKVRVTPAVGASGPTSLRYRVNDGAGVADATLHITLGSPRSLFYYTGEARTPERRIRRYDFFQNIELNTPVPAAEALEQFTVSDDGSMMVYVTRTTSGTPNDRLWVRDLNNPTLPVQQIITSPAFFTYYLQLSPDGKRVAFNDYLANTATPAQSSGIDTGPLENRLFTRDSSKIFYTVVLAGGGRIIKGADINSVGFITNRTQMTHTYQVGEGLGIQFRLTPDETRIISLGVMPAPPATAHPVKQYAFVTTADGSMNDTRLHREFNNPIDGAESLPDVTTDNRFVVYRATIVGTSGLYSSDLQAPGVDTLLATDSPYIGALQAFGSHRVLFGNTTQNSLQFSWRHTDLLVPHLSTEFAPAAQPGPHLVSVAPDGSAVIFDQGANILAAASDLTSSQLVGVLPAPGPIPAKMIYSPDSSSAVVLGGAQTAGLVVNPKAPGWSVLLSPAPAATFSTYCVAYAGQGC